MIRKLLTKFVIAKYLPQNPYPGEMLPVERLRLYQWMTEHHPKVGSIRLDFVCTVLSNY